MEKRTDKYSKDSSLSQSYSESIEKIIGSDTKNGATSIPDTVLQEREQYWDSFIHKYSNLTDERVCEIDRLGQEDTVDQQCLMSKLSFHKSSSFIQYWINTGNHPYKTHEEESEYSDSGSSLSERELSSLSHSMISEHLNKNSATRFHHRDSSSSSVDTTAYILSNTNITEKAKITTILEDAKYSSLLDVRNNGARKMDLTKNRRVGLDNKDILLDTNGNRSNYFCTTSSPATGDSITLNKCNDIPNHMMLKKVVDRNDLQSEYQTVENDNMAITDKAIAEILTGYVENIKEPVNNIKHYSQSTEPIEQHNMEEQSNSWCTSSTKLNRRKKLYSGNDSPVDLAHMESRYTDKLSQTRKSLHPALCPTTEGKQRVRNKQKLVSKRRNRSHFAKQGCLNNCEMRVPLEKDYMENDVASQSGNSYITRECEDADMNINGKHSIENDFVENKMLSSSNGKQHNNTILSSNMSIVANTSGETTSVTKQPSLNLTESVLDLSPEIPLIRLSPREIGKYRMPINCNPKVQLTRLTETDIQNYKANKHKAALLPRIIQDEHARFHSCISTTSTLRNDYEGAQRYESSSSVCSNNNSQDMLYNSEGQSKDRDKTFRGTKAKSNDTDKKSFVTTLSDPLRTGRKMDKSKEMKERGEIRESRKTTILTRINFKSDSEYSNESAASNNKSDESRVVPKLKKNKDKNVNTQDSSSVDQGSERLSNKLTVSPRSSDTSSRSLESKISDDSKAIGNRSFRTNVKACDEKRVKRSFLATSSDENEKSVQRLRAGEPLKNRSSKTASTNRYTNNTIDEENLIRRRMSVMKQPRNKFVNKLLQNRLLQSMNIRHQNRLDTQKELEHSAHKSLGNGSKNKTVRRHRKYYRIVSSSDESRLTDSTHSEMEKSFKGSNKTKKMSLCLRRTESIIANHPDAVVETNKKRRPTRSVASRKIFNRQVFDASTDSSD